MPSDGSHGRPVVLLIDDSPDFRNLLRVALALEQYEVVEASDGQEGLRLFEYCQPGLVLLDIVMPEKDGIETLREILRRKPDARVITFSGRSGAEEHSQVALMLGARRAFTKPFPVADLLEEVRCQLGDMVPAGV